MCSSIPSVFGTDSGNQSVAESVVYVEGGNSSVAGDVAIGARAPSESDFPTGGEFCICRCSVVVALMLKQ